MRVRLKCDELGNSLSYEKRNEFLIAENWEATLFNRQRENGLLKRPRHRVPWLVKLGFLEMGSRVGLIEKPFINVTVCEKVEPWQFIILVTLVV